jgi:hypothetical protein
MITHWKMTWVVAVMAIFAAAMPIQAKPGDRDDRDDRAQASVNVRVVIGDKDNDDDVRALGNWYGFQSSR